MSAQNFAFAIGAGQTVRLPAGRYFMVRTATGAINITTEGNPGSPVRFVGLGAGSKFGPVAEGQGWRNLLVTSAAAQNLEVIISDDGNFDVANAVTISGVPSVQILPASTLADTPFVTCNNAALTQVVPVNLSRRRVGLSISSDTVIAANTVNIRAAGGTNNLLEMVAGALYTFEGTYAISVRNDSGAAINVRVMEES